MQSVVDGRGWFQGPSAGRLAFTWFEEKGDVALRKSDSRMKVYSTP